MTEARKKRLGGCAGVMWPGGGAAERHLQTSGTGTTNCLIPDASGPIISQFLSQVMACYDAVLSFKCLASCCAAGVNAPLSAPAE